MTAFKTIMLTGDYYGFIEPSSGESRADAFRRYCREARRLGFTHLQVNFLADPYHAILMEQPNNNYAWFANYGASLDQFVSSRLNRGLYLEAYLARNRALLVEMAGIVTAEELKPVLLLCEPHFIPERFFQKHPGLRGPRVDNPACSTTPWYALCSDLPEVRAHYQEMLTKLMTYVPQLAGLTLFSHDSGSGFCHSTSLYPGSHGPRHCRGKTVGRRIAEFLGCLREAGVRLNPEFLVSMGTSLDERERAEFLEAAPEGVTGDVYGLYSWCGGLEDQWAAHQYGSRIGQVGYDQARKERIADFEQRVKLARSRGKRVVAINAEPNDSFLSPIRYVPYPFQNLEVLRLLRDMGVTELNCKGKLNIAPWVCHDVNGEVFAAWQANPEAKDIVPRIAKEWVGADHAPALVKAWELVDGAHRRRPLWALFFGRETCVMPGPLVPAPDGLSEDDIGYIYHQAWSDFQSVPGRRNLEILKVDETERAWMLNTYRQETLPSLEQAVEILRNEVRRCNSEEARACLNEQLDHIYHYALWQRSEYNWCEAGCFLAPGKGTPNPERSITEIIDAELAVSAELIALLKGRLHTFMETSPVEGMRYDHGPQFVEQLEQRVSVMRKHRNDPVRTIGGGHG